MASNTTYRTLFEVIYKESIQGSIEDVIRELMPTTYAYILHNCDKEKDGTLKKEHYHIYLNWETPIRMEKIKKVLGITGERKPQSCKDKKGALQYMIHNTKQARALKKHLYKKEEIISNISREDLDYYLSKDADKKSDITRIISLIKQYNELVHICTNEMAFERGVFNEEDTKWIIQQCNEVCEETINAVMCGEYVSYAMFVYDLVINGLIDTYNTFFNSVFKHLVGKIKNMPM